MEWLNICGKTMPTIYQPLFHTTTIHSPSVTGLMMAPVGMWASDLNKSAVFFLPWRLRHVQLPSGYWAPYNMRLQARWSKGTYVDAGEGGGVVDLNSYQQTRKMAVSYGRQGRGLVSSTASPIPPRLRPISARIGETRLRFPFRPAAYTGERLQFERTRTSPSLLHTRPPSWS